MFTWIPRATVDTAGVIFASSHLYPVNIDNVRGARRILQDPDPRVEDQPGVRARARGGIDRDQGGDMPSWMFEEKGSPTERKLRK